MRNVMNKSEVISHDELIDRILRMKELSKITGVSPSTLYDWMNAKSKRYDPSFPRAIRLGAASVGWSLHAVQAWIDSRPQANPMSAQEDQA